MTRQKPNTNVLITRFFTEDGVAEPTDIRPAGTYT